MYLLLFWLFIPDLEMSATTPLNSEKEDQKEHGYGMESNNTHKPEKSQYAHLHLISLLRIIYCVTICRHGDVLYSCFSFWSINMYLHQTVLIYMK
jgi:hypothetical protein